MATSCPNPAAMLILLPLLVSVLRAKAQISTACTSSVITSFTPCLNFVTGSSGTGSSPTEDCCNSIKSLMTDNVDCACLIVTGNVPVSIPFINASMAITLPRACKSSVPLQCKASGVPLPPPGPVLFGPAPAPAAQALAPPPHSHSLTPASAPAPPVTVRAPAPAPAPARAPRAHRHSHSPKASKTVTASPPVESSEEAPAARRPTGPPKFALGPTANPGIRPVFHPDSASAPPSLSFKSISVMYCAVLIMAACQLLLRN